MPFNRAERAWVDNSAGGVDNTVAFGSTKNAGIAGTPHFVNRAFPTLGEQAKSAPPIRIGPYGDKPYGKKSLFKFPDPLRCIV